MPTSLGPLRFRPIFKSALWGGRRIADMLPGAPAAGPISEAWLLSDVDGNVSVVADGPLAGMTLREVMQAHRTELALPHHETFPLLIKIIDAREPLSVQVHPNDEQAQRLANQPRGKTEAWYILHAEPGARVFAGLKPGVNRSDFETALANGRIEDCLHSFEARSGDCVYLPAGTIHAAGGGLTIFEVQQTSDLTYRVYDWGRVEANSGRPRELHVESALECIDFDRGPVQPVRATPGEFAALLVMCEYFEMRRIVSSDELYLKIDECRVIFAVDGRASLESPDTRESAILESGHAFLVPPGPCVLRPQKEIEWLMCRPL